MASAIVPDEGDPHARLVLLIDEVAADLERRLGSPLPWLAARAANIAAVVGWGLLGLDDGEAADQAQFVRATACLLKVLDRLGPPVLGSAAAQLAVRAVPACLDRLARLPAAGRA